ncbi:hypothetical protein SARC_07353 [Sphaeroforma arctica JP610]|uniref:TauD/TfdA-like domain-containing protein n=1 Tax=Sphaeroforma arctica JP610 TaxID=667725 RepID=A0A0L0FWF6_9EUKA|nr:hypothetical protein SARC_07353 [Sphaeroforma arctica JP610]KNC80288.1 hypothetical protein SARC_07353 [Sphaeroforma arctica JP610]|eukprot:XP_014154190.1 hypothetical protein SARC_07353 [Sphaeroforma arctica JP610]
MHTSRNLLHAQKACTRYRSVSEVGLPEAVLRHSQRNYATHNRNVQIQNREHPALQQSANISHTMNGKAKQLLCPKVRSVSFIQYRGNQTQASVTTTPVFDNSALKYEHMHTLPFSSAMGAEVTGVDLSMFSDSDIDSSCTWSDSHKHDVFQEIRQALFRHKMLFFRNQVNLTHVHHQHFASLFGPFAKDAYPSTIHGCEHVKPVIKEAHTHVRMVFGSGWHTDSPFLAGPPHITTLRSVCVPPYGGDTIFANTSLAYSTLSETMQCVIEPLMVRMSLKDVLAQAQVDAGDDETTPLGRLAATKYKGVSADVLQGVRGTLHRLVGVHPVTWEKALFVDGTYTAGIDGMSDLESRAIVVFLLQHITQPAYTCRLRWEKDMLVIWDNRLCIHQAMNDYDGHRRELYRTTNRCV